MLRPQNLSPQTSGLGAKPHQASSLGVGSRCRGGGGVTFMHRHQGWCLLACVSGRPSVAPESGGLYGGPGNPSGVDLGPPGKPGATPGAPPGSKMSPPGRPNQACIGSVNC